MPISGHCHTLYTPQLSITLTGGVRTLETETRPVGAPKAFGEFASNFKVTRKPEKNLNSSVILHPKCHT